MQIEIPKPDLSKPIDRNYMWQLAEVMQQFVDATNREIEELKKQIKGEK